MNDSHDIISSLGTKEIVILTSSLLIACLATTQQRWAVRARCRQSGDRLLPDRVFGVGVGF